MINHKFSIINPKASPYISYIRQGIKHAEGRVFSTKYQKLKIGDTILFYDKLEGIICEIIFLHKYKTFKEMLEIEDPEKMLPQLSNLKIDFNEKIKKGIQIYNNFPNSYKVKKFGCVAIGLRFIKNMD
ncbi:MAG: hypothetical protein GY830_05895 [Bacteroidetes bacterium]|nr:hypothetical protein [Bacteroidota bacterium]